MSASEPQLPIGSMSPRNRLRNAPAIDRLMFRTAWSETDCWLFTGSLSVKGYGSMRSDMNGPVVAVHRVSYEHFHGPIPEGLEIDHMCGVRNCVNPAHLRAVDHATNVRERPTFRPATHCKRGHEFTPENTYLHMVNGLVRCRVCRICSNAKARRWNAQRKATANADR